MQRNQIANEYLSWIRVPRSRISCPPPPGPAGRAGRCCPGTSALAAGRRRWWPTSVDLRGRAASPPSGRPGPAPGPERSAAAGSRTSWAAPPAHTTPGSEATPADGPPLWRDWRTHLGQEAFDGRIRSDQVQEGRQSPPEAGCRYANEKRPVVAEADVVRVTDHVIQDGLPGSRLGALEPEPKAKWSRGRSANIRVNYYYGMGCLYLRIRPMLVSASSRKRSSGDRTTPLGM